MSLLSSAGADIVGCESALFLLEKLGLDPSNYMEVLRMWCVFRRLQDGNGIIIDEDQTSPNNWLSSDIVTWLVVLTHSPLR